jgi:hypothetical protein
VNGLAYISAKITCAMVAAFCKNHLCAFGRCSDTKIDNKQITMMLGST